MKEFLAFLKANPELVKVIEAVLMAIAGALAQHFHVVIPAVLKSKDMIETANTVSEITDTVKLTRDQVDVLKTNADTDAESDKNNSLWRGLRKVRDVLLIGLTKG